MTASGGSPQHHIYQVAMTPQLSNLTNTLKKKKCVGGHRGECLHSRTMTRTRRSCPTAPPRMSCSGPSVPTATSTGRLTPSDPTSWPPPYTVLPVILVTVTRTPTTTSTTCQTSARMTPASLPL